MKHVKRPCDECPWRKDAETGRFSPERWEALRATSPDEQGFGPNFAEEACEVTPPIMFACHKTPDGGERACAGWLAVEGVNHPIVRLALLAGDLDARALKPGEDWPVLHPDFHATMQHDMKKRH